MITTDHAGTLVIMLRKPYLFMCFNETLFHSRSKRNGKFLSSKSIGQSSEYVFFFFIALALDNFQHRKKTAREFTDRGNWRRRHRVLKRVPPNSRFDPQFNKLFHIHRHAAEEQRLQTSSHFLRFR